jgi:hypothetical protein
MRQLARSLALTCLPSLFGMMTSCKLIELSGIADRYPDLLVDFVVISVCGLAGVAVTFAAMYGVGLVLSGLTGRRLALRHLL